MKDTIENRYGKSRFGKTRMTMNSMYIATLCNHSIQYYFEEYFDLMFGHLGVTPTHKLGGKDRA